MVHEIQRVRGIARYVSPNQFLPVNRLIILIFADLALGIAVVSRKLHQSEVALLRSNLIVHLGNRQLTQG